MYIVIVHNFFSSVICLRQFRWGLFWFNSIDRFDSDCMKQKEKLSETGVLMCRTFPSIILLCLFCVAKDTSSCE